MNKKKDLEISQVGMHILTMLILVVAYRAFILSSNDLSFNIAYAIGSIFSASACALIIAFIGKLFKNPAYRMKFVFVTAAWIVLILSNIKVRG